MAVYGMLNTCTTGDNEFLLDPLDWAVFEDNVKAPACGGL
jgi:hypothetical protein